MRNTNRLILAVSSVGFVIVGAAPDFHRTRPRVHCAIPSRDYQYKRFSQPLRSLSSVPVVVDIPSIEYRISGGNLSSTARSSAERDRLTVKSFQFVEDPTLVIDHCSISQMSVLLDETGRWTVSLRGNQNPLDPSQVLNVTTIEPRQLFTDHLKRNLFHVVARCYVQHGPGDANTLIGKPLVIPIELKPFWVQRQQPYKFFKTDYHPDIQRYFESIDRVEIEFKYQRD